MATQKPTNPNPRKTYSVLSPYQCSNTRNWLQKGDSVELLPCEAEFLQLSGKIKLTTNVVSKTTK